MAEQGISLLGGGWTQAKPAPPPPAAKSSKPASSGSAKSGQPASGSGGKRRVVRTAQGAARYHVPIGSEIIAKPRDARGAQAQTDTESVGRYKALVGQDSAAQQQALQKLSDDQLRRLNDVAFSFGSTNPEVARLRAGTTIEMQRRHLVGAGLSGRGPAGSPAATGAGIQVTNWATGEHYTVATKGDTKAAKAAQTQALAQERLALRQAVATERARIAKATAERKAAEKQAKAQQVAAAKQLAAQQKAARSLAARSPTPSYSSSRRHVAAVQMSGLAQTEVIELADIPDEVRQKAAARGDALPGGRFPIRNVNDLRNAIQAFGRVKPEDRERVARFICRRAKALNAEHMLGDGIRTAAGYSTDTKLSAMVDPKVIELEGKWKHGWIPLDPTAVAIKAHRKPGGGSGRLAPKHEGGKLTPKHERGQLLPRHSQSRVIPADKAGPAFKTKPRSDGAKSSGGRTSVVKSGMTPNNASTTSWTDKDQSSLDRLHDKLRTYNGNSKYLTPNERQLLNVLEAKKKAHTRPQG